MKAVESGHGTVRSLAVTRRFAGPSALAVTLVYLAWRAQTLGSGRLLWLSIPLFAAEVCGATSLAALVHQSRHGALRSEAIPAHRIPAHRIPATDVVISVGDDALDDLERTLVACRALPGQRSVMVVDHGGRSGVADLADAHGARHRRAPQDPLDNPTLLFDEAGSEMVLWLAAGHTPMPDVDIVARRLDDPAVAVVQIGVGLLNSDSFAHVEHGRDESALMRSVIGPALSTRGVAPWFGPGSFLRRSAIAPAQNATTVERLAVRLHRAGWRTEFEGRPVVRTTAPDTLAQYLSARRLHTRRQLSVLRSSDSPLTGRHIPKHVRATHLGLLLPFGTGLRLCLLLGVTVATLLTGTMPFAASTDRVAVAWIVATTVGVLARRVIVGSTMAVGDWIRGAWRTLGADIGAMGDVVRHTGSSSGADDASRGWHSMGRLRLLVSLVILLELAIVARATTLVGPDLLPAFERHERVAVLVFALGLLAPMVDVVQLIVTRRQRRHQFRIDAVVPVLVNGVASMTVDLSAQGVAVILSDPPPEGALVDLRLSLPRISGEVSIVNAVARVRSVLTATGDASRVGLEIAQIAPAARSTLIAFCCFDHPYLEREVPQVAPQVAPSELHVDGRRRVALRALTALAVLLGACTALAGPAAAAAAEVGDVTVRVLDADGKPVSDVRVRYYRTEWHDAPATSVGGETSIGVPTGETEFEVTVDDQRVVMPITVEADGSSVMMVELARLFADPGASVGEINSGGGWRPFIDVMEVLPGHVAVRSEDGSVAKLDIVAGVVVSVPSGKVIGR